MNGGLQLPGQPGGLQIPNSRRRWCRKHRLNLIMIRIQNKRRYSSYLGSLVLWVTVGFMTLTIISQEYSLPFLFLYILILFILFSGKFTSSVEMDKKGVRIVYLRFFSRREIFLPADRLEISLRKAASFRSPAYLILEISGESGKVFEIDGRDGFQDGELKSFAEFYEQLRCGCEDAE